MQHISPGKVPQALRWPTQVVTHMLMPGVRLVPLPDWWTPALPLLAMPIADVLGWACTQPVLQLVRKPVMQVLPQALRHPHLRA